MQLTSRCSYDGPRAGLSVLRDKHLQGGSFPRAAGRFPAALLNLQGIIQYMSVIRTATISSLPVIRDIQVTGDDIIPMVDTGSGTNKTITLNSLASHVAPVGSVVLFLKQSSKPSFFLPCTGGFVNAGAYADLYSVLGKPALSGNDFKLPNLSATDSNVLYYICAGDALPSTYQPVLTSSSTKTNLVTLTSTANTVFGFPAAMGGGGGTVSVPYLSASVVVASSVFTVPTTISLAQANGSNATAFFNTRNPYESVLFFSNTGSDAYGLSALSVQSVTGGTRFTGINTISALPLLSTFGNNAREFIPHMPVTIVNNAANSTNFATYLAGSYRGSTTINFTVPAFEYTVNGQKYTLKSYIVSRGGYTIPAIYNKTGTYSKDAVCDGFVRISGPLSAENIAFNPSLSAVLGTPAMRNKLLSDSDYSPFAPGLSSLPGLFMSLSAGFGYYQKSIFFTNPMRVDGQWGYPINSTTPHNQQLLPLFINNRYPVTDLNIVLSGTNRFYSSSYTAAASAVRYTYNTLGISKLTVCESLTSQIGNIKYHSVKIPIDNIGEKLLISYYAR